MVFLAGLPGTGKSLLIHQLAHLAHAAGREVSLIQWDVVRPAVEASPAGARYPEAEGIAHPVIRKAAGVWSRGAVARWHARAGGAGDAAPGGRASGGAGTAAAGPLLIGETPLIGLRFVELARRADDAAEPSLAAASCRFVIPVPSRAVRSHLEGERGRRAQRPAHGREREDAAPSVVAALWDELVRVAADLGIAPYEGPGRGGAPPAYDPDLYERVYGAVLRHRRAERLSIDEILPARGMSAYAFTFQPHEVVPAPDEAAAAVREVERAYPDRSRLEDEIDRWYVV